MECIRESELRELFREFDKNGDGKITREELEMALIQLGERPSSSHIEAIINQTDIDGQFPALRKTLLNPREERELREVFSVFDKNGDGMISGDDLLLLKQSLGKKPSETDAREMIKEGDVDRDGLISFHAPSSWYLVQEEEL
ncbi:EF hand [Teladorsagia circumcincta]|uniref:EF hand n=1 Tax=Teladorsagia circumcincta TaxID=45464 RepID=A0A2G9U1F0_TELCI|nr:EF hand [Teladorsagia circumcincta]